MLDRHSKVVDLFSMVGMTITGSLGVLALFSADYPLGLLLIAASLVYLVAYRIHKLTKDSTLSAAIIVYSLHALTVSLVYSGGVENTGPLWLFLVPPVSLFLHGLKRGLIEISISLSILCLILFLPPDVFGGANYETAFKLRLIIAFITVTFLAACYEYSIEQSYKDTLQASEQFEQLARTDQLTKLCNRRGALTVIEQEQRRMSRNKQAMSIILCDVDHFKKVNDQYGHNTGDAVLVSLAETFTQLIRQQDTIARWGGEEFLFVLPETSAENAYILSQKIHQVLQDQLIDVEGIKIAVTVSMGVTEMHGNQAFDEIINQADKHLYEAKRAGRNQTMPKTLSTEG
jgi:diguanylate cyclase (GGDEF)-like protein